MFKDQLQQEANEDNLQLYEGATAVSLTEADGTYTGTAPLPRHIDELGEE